MTEQHMPLVSIIIATYRRDKELIRALESVASQTYKNIEIIIADDNANYEWNKKVEEIVKTFKEQNANIPVKHIINSSNKGSAESRNEGIWISTGNYICFLDDDDIYLPERVTTQLSAMVNNHADYSITDLALYSEEDLLVEFRRRDYIKQYSKESLIKYHLMYHMTGTDTLMFRTEYLKSIGGFPPIDLGDEFYLMMKAIEKDGVLHYLPCCHVKAYVHRGENGLSSGQSKIDGENRLFEYKQNFFSELDSSTRNYIKVRHYAVLTYAYIKKRDYIKVVTNAITAMLISPINCLKVFYRIVKK